MVSSHHTLYHKHPLSKDSITVRQRDRGHEFYTLFGLFPQVRACSSKFNFRTFQGNRGDTMLWECMGRNLHNIEMTESIFTKANDSRAHILPSKPYKRWPCANSLSQQRCVSSSFTQACRNLMWLAKCSPDVILFFLFIMWQVLHLIRLFKHPHPPYKFSKVPAIIFSGLNHKNQIFYSAETYTTRSKFVHRSMFLSSKTLKLCPKM